MNFNLGKFLYFGIGLLQISLQNSQSLNTHIIIKCYFDHNHVGSNESFHSIRLEYQNSLVASINHTGETFINATSSFAPNVTFSPVTSFQINLELDVASNYLTSHFDCYIKKLLSANNSFILEKNLVEEEKESTNDDGSQKDDSSQDEGLQGTHLIIALSGTGMLIVLIVIVVVPIGVWRKRKDRVLEESPTENFYRSFCDPASVLDQNLFPPDLYTYRKEVDFFFLENEANVECSPIEPQPEVDEPTQSTYKLCSSFLPLSEDDVTPKCTCKECSSIKTGKIFQK
ncbi:uncharacterized protein LOC106051273 isoform X2 [Biomphalaria glabrata]|uniref:Uncharacterized protein LOC106051273 isoform X2 n=1 Tax=Biomphalaria glabrata TaxID=6526 RepID=A0A9W3AMX6_BIOGL|nr:uncharacterized protein LOC106051273 isoform X2 [Biomphalaria glabrata]